MFDRPHHKGILKILHAFNSDFLQKAECFFGGGTAIVLSLGEYRESNDIDFLCASINGYRFLRNTVSGDLGQLLKTPIKHLREVRADRYGIRTILEMDGIPIKVEIVSEGRITVYGNLDPIFHVPTLSREDMYAEKLLADADRGMDKSTMSRDIIDLAMMINNWGDIPDQSWMKAYAAYGIHVVKEFQKTVELIHDKKYLADCLQKMHMDKTLLDRISTISGKIPSWISEPDDQARCQRRLKGYEP